MSSTVGGTDNHIAVRLAEKRWQLLHPGVYLVGCAPRDVGATALAAVLACGGDARTSHETAAAVHGLDGAEERTPIQ